MGAKRKLQTEGQPAKDKKEKKDKKQKDKKEKKRSKNTVADTNEESEAEAENGPSNEVTGPPGTAAEAIGVPMPRTPPLEDLLEDQPEVAITSETIKPRPQSPTEVLKDIATRILVSVGGSCSLTDLEIRTGCTLPMEVSNFFETDRAMDYISLTGKQVCELLEAPGFNLAALEESYFDLGEEVLRAGLDFTTEDRFEERFNDLLAKREEIRDAVVKQKAGTGEPLWSSGSRNRQLAPMNRDELELLESVMRVVRALSRHQPWIPMSRLLEDTAIRRGRSLIPQGLALWEWLSLRCSDELSMATDGKDLIVNYTPRGEDSARRRASALAKNGDEGLDAGQLFAEESEERRLALVVAAFEKIREFATEFPRAGGVSLDELVQLPSIARLRFHPLAVQRTLESMPQTFGISKGPLGLSIRLRGGAVHPTSKASKDTGDARQEQPVAKKRPGDKMTVEEWALEQETRFPGLPALPSGWIRAISNSTQKMYYINRVTGLTQLDPPAAAAQR